MRSPSMSTACCKTARGSSVSITDDRSVIVEVTVRGKGTLPVDVYLDGAIYDSQLILFE